jgi:hypothetical protein
MPEVSESKICTKCRDEKPIDQFSLGNAPDGRKYWCKKCCSDSGKELWVKYGRHGRIPMVPGSMETLRKKIKDSSVPEPNSGCHLWELSVDKNGYGNITWNGKIERANRLSYAAFVGEIPVDKPFVCHTCDTPSCVNPLHLFVSTVAGNNADCVLKGRTTRGERSNTAQLSESDVTKIITLRAFCGKNCREIADQYGMNRSSILSIVTGTNWKHLSHVRQEILSMAGLGPPPDRKMSTDQFEKVMDVWFDYLKEESTECESSDLLL